MAETFVVSDTGKPEILKDPNAILDYSFDWTTWLGADTISGVQVLTDDASLLVQGAPAHNGKIATVWVSGGTPGGKAAVTCRITTTEGRVDDRTVYLKIRER